MTSRADSHVAATTNTDPGSGTRILWQATALMLALLVLSAVATLFDERTLRDVNVWIKPMKFQASLAMYLVTLALIAPLIDQKTRASAGFRFTLFAGAAAGLIEIAYITLQAARGRASHFNFETPFESAMYQLMGFAAVVLVAVSAAVGVWLLRRPNANVPRALELGGGWGLILGSVFTLLIAGYMSGLTDHLVVAGVSDADGMPVTGWSTSTGDLRVPHFFATHMMQALPVIAWIASRYFATQAVRITVFGGILWTALTVATLIQALGGKPLLG